MSMNYYSSRCVANMFLYQSNYHCNSRFQKNSLQNT